MANDSILFGTMLAFFIASVIAPSSAIVNKDHNPKPCTKTWNEILQQPNEYKPLSDIYQKIEKYELAINLKNNLIDMQKIKMTRMENNYKTLQLCNENSIKQIQTKYEELQNKLTQTEEKLHIAENKIHNQVTNESRQTLTNVKDFQIHPSTHKHETTAKVNQLNTEIIKLKSRYDNCQYNITNITKELNYNTQIVNSNYLTIRRLNALLNALKVEANNNASELTKLKIEISEKDNLIHDLEMNLNNENQTLSIQIANSNANKFNLELCQKEYKQIQSNQATCLTRLNDFEILNNNLESKVTSQTNELQHCKYMVNNLEEAIRDQRDSFIDQKANEIINLTSQLSNLTIEFSECNSAAINLQNTVNKLVQEQQNVTIAINDNKLKLNEALLNNSRLSTKLTMAQKDLTDCDYKIYFLDVKMQDLTDQLKNVDSANTTTCDDQENQNIKTNLENCKNELHQQIEEQKTDKNAINDYKIKLKELYSNNTRLSNELTKTQKNLTDCDTQIYFQDIKLQNLRDELQKDIRNTSNCDDHENKNLKNKIQNCENELNKKMQSTTTYVDEDNDNIEINLQNKCTALESKFQELKSTKNNLTCQLKICSSQLNELGYMQKKEPNVDCPPFKVYTGKHLIPLENGREVTTPCNSDYENNEWSVIQRRLGFETSFNRSWVEYRNGFGNFSSEFILGLENIHRITSMRRHHLYVRLTDGCETVYARYDNFAIGNNEEGYAIKSLGNYSGNAEDGLRESLNMKFSTYDMDNDLADYNCAESGNGGWWYANCGNTNLNHKHFRSGFVMWNNWYNHYTSIEMMIRPVKINDNYTVAQE